MPVWRSERGRVAALVLGCAFVLGCASAPAAPRELREPVDVGVYARLLRMADARTLDTALVRRAWTSRASAVRAAATRAVGQVHGTALAADLRTLLADPDTAVAANAAFALGLMQDSASVGALARALAAPPTVGAAAAWALGHIGARAGAAIESALADHARPAAVTGALLLAAATRRPLPAAAVESYFVDGDAAIRWRAVYAVARAPAPAAVRAVLALVQDTSALVREQVARALDHRATGDSLGAPAQAALDTLARDPDPHVRITAVRALATYGTASRDVVLGALRDADGNVRITAAQALARVLDAPRATWMQAWRADTGFMYRRSVLISALTHDVVLPAAEFDNPDGWAHQGDWRYRAAVADAGAAAPSIERMREVSLPFTRDPDPRVRAAGFAALAPHADTAEHHPWRREYMYFGLHDADADVRALSTDALTPHANAAELPHVLDAYRRAASDSIADARLAAVHYFTSAWRRDSAAFTDTVIAALRALPAPPDAIVRDAARSCTPLDAWAASSVPPPARPLAWYETIVRTLVLPALDGVLPHAVIATARGDIDIELYAADAPLTVDNFLDLVRSGYYRHIAFHRVVPDFVAQDGDRRGDGNGGPAYAIRDELNRRPYDRGAVGMALSGPDTGGSQYFITLSAQPHLDGGYTVFGHVDAGWAALDALVQGDSISAIRTR